MRLHYREQGPRGGPPVLLAPSLGTTTAMWDELAGALAGGYRVIRFDTRGHGGSPVPPGPYSTQDLADDVLELADTLALERFALVGLSLGGTIAQTLALSDPDRLSAMALCCTGASIGDPANWRERARRVRAEGMSWLVEPTKERWFTPGFPQEQSGRAGQLLDQIAATPPEGYAACCEALAGFDSTADLARIRTPTRVIAGSDDAVTPPPVGEVLRDGIPDADLVIIENAAHIANVNAPAPFNTAVIEHLERNL